MSGLIFDKLTEVEELKMVNPKYVEDFQNSSDFNKIEQIILQYQSKYARDLVPLKQISKPLAVMKEQLHKNVINLYSFIEERNNVEECKEEVIVLDYLVTLRQLIGLLQGNDLEGFHIKSKIETIV